MSELSLTDWKENLLVNLIEDMAEHEEEMSIVSFRRGLYQLGAFLYRSYYDLDSPVSWQFAGVSHPTMKDATRKSAKLKSSEV